MADHQPTITMVLLILPMSLLFCAYHILRTLPPGLPRLICILPLLATIAPIAFSAPTYSFRSLASFCLLWVCPTKLLLLSFDISIDDIVPHLQSFPLFLISVTSPLRIKSIRSTTPSPSPSKRDDVFSFFLHLAGLILVFNVSFLHRKQLPIWLLNALVCAEIYLGLEVLFGGIAMIVYFVAGVETYRPSDSPFMAVSLSEFWGKRWNLLVTTMLRASVYDPMLRWLTMSKEGKGWGKQGMKERNRGVDAAASTTSEAKGKKDELPSTARCVATLATFACSGLVHEAIFFSMTKSPATGEYTLFFLLHGFATILEKLLSKMTPRAPLPRPARIAITLGFLYITVSYLFVPTIYRTKTDLYANAEFYQIQKTIVEFFSGLI